MTKGVCPKPERRHHNRLGITPLVPEPLVSSNGLVDLILIMHADDVRTTTPLSEESMTGPIIERAFNGR
jgi:hypothetical protein